MARGRQRNKVLENTLLFLIQEVPRIHTCLLCRVMNERPERYCSDKICFANPRKRARKGKWAHRPLLQPGCRYPLSTIRTYLRRMKNEGLILIRKEKKPDGDNFRGWDWMKVCYATGLKWIGGCIR